MTRTDKIRICDWTLLFLTIVTLASGIQLEASGSSGHLPVIFHVVVGSCFFFDVVWHLYLHFGWKEWAKRLRRQKSPVTRWLAIFALLTFMTGTAALIHWAGSYIHSPLGGVHGKIGFIFMALAIGHIARRVRFYKYVAARSRQISGYCVGGERARKRGMK